MNTPTLLKAAKMIGYDNGMINRLNSQDQFLKQVAARLCVFSAEELKEVEEELSKLSPEVLDDAVCGVQYHSLSELADRVLNTIFEEPSL